MIVIRASLPADLSSWPSRSSRALMHGCNEKQVPRASKQTVVVIALVMVVTYTPTRCLNMTTSHQPNPGYLSNPRIHDVITQRGVRSNMISCLNVFDYFSLQSTLPSACISRVVGQDIKHLRMQCNGPIDPYHIRTPRKIVSAITCPRARSEIASETPRISFKLRHSGASPRSQYAWTRSGDRSRR